MQITKDVKLTIVLNGPRNQVKVSLIMMVRPFFFLNHAVQSFCFINHDGCTIFFTLLRRFLQQAATPNFSSSKDFSTTKASQLFEQIINNQFTLIYSQL
jgi:hypothetical protein